MGTVYKGKHPYMGSGQIGLRGGLERAPLAHPITLSFGFDGKRKRLYGSAK